MPEKDWNDGYRVGVRHSMDVINRANLDRVVKNILRNRMKHLLLLISGSEPKIKLHELKGEDS